MRKTRVQQQQRQQQQHSSGNTSRTCRSLGGQLSLISHYYSKTERSAYSLTLTNDQHMPPSNR